ncbi:MAG: PD-(D/E)XK nuclease family protein [Nanoarchaeota archaeon]|nr:PD-(D/E)XK nuclease family protein [Nanoarchaeota archaeon]
MVRFSASMLDCVNVCKRVYYYRYVDKPEVNTNPHIALGTVLHRMFDRFYRNYFKSEESFLKQYAHEWNKACQGESDIVKGIWIYDEGNRDEILNSFFWIGWHIGSKFYNRHEDKREELEEKRIELKDNIKRKVEGSYLRQDSLVNVTKKQIVKATKNIIKDEYNIERAKLFPWVESAIKFQWEGFDLVAKIDRIDKLNREHYITDYKTGKKIDESYRNHQFTIYYLAALNEFGKPPKGMIKSFVRLGKDIPVVFGDEHFQYLKDDLEEASRFLKEISEALEISRKRKRLTKKQKKKGIIALPFEDLELEWANDVLNIHKFRPRREGQCFFCDYNSLCKDQIENREEELRKINNADELEDRIESFWNEIEFE